MDGKKKEKKKRKSKSERKRNPSLKKKFESTMWSIDLFMFRILPKEDSNSCKSDYIMLHCSSFPPNFISFFVGLLFMDSSNEGFS